MNEPVLTAGIEDDGDGRVSVLSPEVGEWSDLPHPGAVVGPGSAIGVLSRLTRRFRLVLPDGAAGRIVDGLSTRRVVAVEYGQALFRLAPIDSAIGEAIAVGGPATAGGLAAGLHAVVAPTDGVFYRRPAPDDPPFVEVGARVAAGQPVGLVEVMKTFNQIHYGGPGWPEHAEVVEVRADDGEEVSAGQVLIVVR